MNTETKLILCLVELYKTKKDMDFKASHIVNDLYKIDIDEAVELLEFMKDRGWVELSRSCILLDKNAFMTLTMPGKSYARHCIERYTGEETAPDEDFLKSVLLFKE